LGCRHDWVALNATGDRIKYLGIIFGVTSPSLLMIQHCRSSWHHGPHRQPIADVGRATSGHGLEVRYMNEIPACPTTRSSASGLPGCRLGRADVQGNVRCR